MKRVIDLFAGIGGFSLGLERAGGYRPVGFVEIKPHAQAVLAKNWPDVPIWGDITTREFREGEADVITAGFPCQDISFAGAGAGLSGVRSGLYREVVRALRLVRPAYAILENVAALLSRGLGTVLGDLAEIGYDAEWHCIPASAVGAPHRRDRIWIVANPGSEQHEGHRAPLSGELAKELYGSFADADEFHDDPSGHGSGEICRKQQEQTCLPRCDAADATGEDDRPCYSGKSERQVPELGNGSCAANVAYPEVLAERAGLCSGVKESIGWGRSSYSGGTVGNADVADAGEQRLSPSEQETVLGPWWGEEGRAASKCGWWSAEPSVDRVAHGVPNRVDRLEELGNAVVPQIPEVFGRVINAVW